MYRDVEFLTGGALLLVILPALLALAVPYAVLALRDSRSVVRDPQVGWKAVLYFMFSLCILLALAALTLLVVDLLADDVPSRRRLPAPPRMSAQQRTALALLTSAIAVGLVHLGLIHFASNTRLFPDTRRVFVGCRLAVHALVVLGSFTMVLYQLYQPIVDREALRPPFGVLLVWGPSWVCHLVLLRIYTTSSVPAPARAFPSPPPENDE